MYKCMEWEDQLVWQQIIRKLVSFTFCYRYIAIVQYMLTQAMAQITGSVY